jgi:hypothetical protein
MTGQSVSIIITIKAGQMTSELEQTLDVEELEKAMASFTREMHGKIFSVLLELLDKQIQKALPCGWINVGREPRSLIFEHGYVSYRRRIYMDEKGRRRKPLDELLEVEAYARSSQKVGEAGCALASEGTFRQAARLLSYLLKTGFSASSIHRMVRKLGQRIEAQENRYQSTEAGSIQAAVLNCEADGVWLHMQGEQQRRMEVKVAVMYTGKKTTGNGRYCCNNKVFLTQLGGSTKQWQIKLRELADQTYDLSSTRMLAVGGDGATWVKQSFELLGLPTAHLLDRFHVVRAVNRTFGKAINTPELLKTLFSEGLEAVEPQLQACIHRARGSVRKKQREVWQYLDRNRDALIDLDKRGLPNLPFSTLGAAEGNVDKLVRQRMEGRGLCWSLAGAQAMLAVLRHKQQLLEHSFKYIAVAKPDKFVNRVKGSQNKEVYSPYSVSVPIFSGSDASKPWVQLLKRKIDDGLSLNAYL